MLRCIRFGEVLLDESFRTFLICNQCQTEFVEVSEFRIHLSTSSCGERLFKEDVIGLKFGAAQVTRSGKGKTYLLYNPADVQLATSDPVNITTATPTDAGDDAYLDLMKIEEELLDPRWYTDITSTQPDVKSPQQTASLPVSGNTNKPMEYKELVEAVGPYVQFKEIATKRKSDGIVVRRFPNKSNKPTTATTTKPVTVKNPVLPVKSSQTTDQTKIRLLNPATKRKLDMTTKQVQFNDTVNVKYVINDKLCLNATANKLLTTRNTEMKEKTEVAVTASKRRKTITLAMDQACIHPELQEQVCKRNSHVPKTTLETAAVGNNVERTTVTKLATKPKNVASNVAANNSKPIATSKPQSGAHIKNLVNQKQINGAKLETSSSRLIVRNPIANSKLNSNEVKKAPNAANKLVPSATKPHQRTVSANSTVPPQSALYVPAKQATPPALAPLSSNKISNTVTKATVDSHQQTNDILNKLQTRGLQVKRTQPPSAVMPNTTNVGQHSKTMELLQKLESKGMKVKILNGGKQTASATAAPVTHVNTSINLPTTVSTPKMVNNVGNVATAIGKQTNKTILNNKLIIKKVK